MNLNWDALTREMEKVPFSETLDKGSCFDRKTALLAHSGGRQFLLQTVRTAGVKIRFSDHEIQIVDGGGGVGQALPDRLTWHWLDGVQLLRCPQRGRRAMSGGNR
jgi:hypothetical protein